MSLVVCLQQQNGQGVEREITEKKEEGKFGRNVCLEIQILRVVLALSKMLSEKSVLCFISIS